MTAGPAVRGAAHAPGHLDLGDLDDEHAADLGRHVVRIERAVNALPHFGRVHVSAETSHP